MKKLLLAATMICLFFGVGISHSAESKLEVKVDKKSRCPVCGMFVANYAQWLTYIKLSDGSSELFDGVKDMMAYYFSPQKFGAAKGLKVEEVLVKTYYSQKWVNGKEAFYVVGSDVYGPMGHELIPFTGKAEAESFYKDHQGTHIFTFSEIDAEMLEALRKGHKMKKHKKN